MLGLFLRDKCQKNQKPNSYYALLYVVRNFLLARTNGDKKFFAKFFQKNSNL